MSRTAQVALARIAAIEEANAVIACQKGRIARANNRPRSGVLVPKEIAATPALLAEFERGWDATNAAIAAVE